MRDNLFNTNFNNIVYKSFHQDLPTEGKISQISVDLKSITSLVPSSLLEIVFKHSRRSVIGNKEKVVENNLVFISSSAEEFEKMKNLKMAGDSKKSTNDFICR